MVSDEKKNKGLRILFVIGLVIAVISAFETRIDWLAAFCGFWGDGCQEAATVKLFKLPIPVWGVIYYLVLIICSFFAREWLFIVVMAGAGFEMTLVSMMMEMKWVCIFCIFNLAVVMLSVILLYENKRLWQALAMAVIFFMASDHLLSQKSPHRARPKVKTAGPVVVAQVGDDFIYEDELNESLAAQIYKLEKKIYELKKERLDYLIDSHLISMDAEEKGLSPEVYTFKVFNEGMEVSDGDVDTYITSNPGIEASWKGREGELRKRVKQYLQNMKTREKVETITRPLKEKYTIDIFLDPPPLPLTSISQGSSPSIGPEDAEVVVYEFSDYQCPVCRKAHKVSVNIRKRFNGKIRWVFKDHPLNRHQDAWGMAQAARCANDQGKFWEYQDYLYGMEGHPDINTYSGFAEKLDLDMDRFTQCIESKKYKNIIEKEKAEGQEAGVSSTPTFVINGRLRPGYISEEKMTEWIREELEKDEL